MKMKASALRLVLITLLAGLLNTTAFAAVITLPKYNVSVNDVSVSGFSSGGHMAAQMHFAYSGTIKKGAGVIAGGPVYCSQGSVAISVDDLRTMYSHYVAAANLYYKNDLAVEHSIPTDSFGSSCTTRQSVCRQLQF